MDDLIERLRECEYLCSSLRGHLDDAGYLEGGAAHSKLAIIDDAVTKPPPPSKRFEMARLPR